jgi:imidazolonepropionase-like amidohydrolase
VRNALLRSLLALATLPTLAAEAPLIVLRGARVVSVAGPTLEHGVVILAGGKIAAIGADLETPPGATVIELDGQTVYPGLIDALSQVGLTEISAVRASMDLTEVREINPQVKAWVALNPHTAHIPVARANGITAVQAAPRGRLISGQGAVIRLTGSTPDALTVKAAASLQVEYPSGDAELLERGDDAQEPEKFSFADRGTQRRKNRERALERLTNLFEDARAYGAAMDAARLGTASRPQPDPILEGLVPLVRGELPLQMRADTEEDIRGAVAFAEARGLKLTVTGGLEAWRCAELLKQKDVAVLLKVLRLPRRRSDPYDAAYANAAVLQKAGVRFAIVSDDDSTCRNLPYEAAMAEAYGLSADAALRAITLSAAEILGIDARMGSLEAGKDANVIVADGDILDHRTHVTRVFIDGVPQSLETRHTALYEAFRNRP